MTQVIPIERKSAVLTPSSLACLAHVPTVNLTAGCAHECRYCYARSYLTHPGKGKITFYTNTLAKLREELQRKRKKPTTVYFSPSSDPFQPVPEVLDMAYDVFKHLFNSGIGVTFVTKGRIPARHRKLLAAHAPLVQGRIGRLIDAYENGLLNKEEFEPRIQSRKDRLARLEEEAASLAAIHEQQSQLRLAIGQLNVFSRQIAAGLDNADFATEREIIRAIVKRIEIDHEEVRVVYRISPRPFVPRPASGAILQHCRRPQGAFRQTLTDSAVLRAEPDP